MSPMGPTGGMVPPRLSMPFGAAASGPAAFNSMQTAPARPAAPVVPTGAGQSAGGVEAGAPSGVPGAPNTVPRPTDKPTNPSLTVDDYLKANKGVLGKLGNQEGVKDKLKQRYGDWDDPNRSEEDRRQSAYNASRHVGIIKHKKAWDGSDRDTTPGSITQNGKMDGATKDNQIRAGTELADLKDSLKGSGPEQDQNTDTILSRPNLARTKDTRVNKDGTTKGNFKWFVSEAGKALSFIPGLSNVLKGIGNSEGGFFGAIKGAFGGVFKTWKADAKGAVDAVTTGKVNPTAGPPPSLPGDNGHPGPSTPAQQALAPRSPSRTCRAATNPEPAPWPVLRSRGEASAGLRGVRR